MLIRSTRISIASAALALSGCSAPLLVEGNGPSAKVDVRNASRGYLQVMTFNDPQTCNGVQLVGYTMEPGQQRPHALPADRPITIAVNAWGLPTTPDKVAWCPPVFVSTKLKSNRSYRISFHADSVNKTCGVSIQDEENGSPVPAIRRSGSGPGVGSSAVAGSFSCKPAVEFDSL
jgi:hypothetical protein